MAISTATLLTIIGMIGSAIIYALGWAVALGIFRGQFNSLRDDVKEIKKRLNNGIIEIQARHDERLKALEDACEIK